MNFNFIGDFLNYILNNFFNNGQAVALATLFATIITGIGIPLMIYALQQSRVEPWSMEKLNDEEWILRRLGNKKSSLYGYGVDNHNSVEILYQNLAGIPPRFFGRGSYTTFRIEGPIGGNITFYYREYGKFNKITADDYAYHGEISRYTRVPSDVKGWSNPLY